MNSIEELIVKLGDPHRRIRQETENELEKIGGLAVDPLINALEDEDWPVRGRAASALGEIKNARAIEPHIRRFDDHLQVQIRVSLALGKIGKPALEPLPRTLTDNN